MTESLDASLKLNKRFFGGGPVLLGIYVAGYHEKCLGQAPLSYTGCPKTNATCLTDCNFAYSASKLVNDGSF